MTIASKKNCGVCGADLVHGKTPVSMTCAYCGNRQETLIHCPHGHYVCDACHSRSALDLAATLLHNSTSRDPRELLEMLMSHASVPMHGPEHHFFVPAVLVAAARNVGYPVPKEAIDEAVRRGSRVPGGWCGYYGVCGAGAGVGIAVSVLTGATPVKGVERTLANQATAKALTRIGDGHPRCCKRASRTAIEVGIAYLREHLGIELEDGRFPACQHFARNRECPLGECPYHPAHAG